MKQVPELGPNRPLRLPDAVERTLANGLTVIAICRPAVPLVELRLRVPFASAPLPESAVLSQSIFSGTDTMSVTDIAAELQKVGGGLSAGTDPDRLMISGNGLVTGLDRLLEILAGVLTGAAYPDDEVTTEAARLADRIRVARSQPAHIARAALLKRLYAGHPYAVQTPEPEQVVAVTAEELRELHAERVRATGATLVLVGDIDPAAALDSAERALDGWAGDGKLVELAPIPEFGTGPLTLVDRPGAVQSSLRVALPGIPRTHPNHAALQLANLVFGGYFSSRWVENIREDKGYTYHAHSTLEHAVAGSTLIAASEVATEVTASALLETLYELGRIATQPPKPDELEQARQYALGTLLLGISTQAGLAGLATTYAGFGLRLDYLVGHAQRLAEATADEVAAAASAYLAPAQALLLVVGDAATIEPGLATLRTVHRRQDAD